MSQASSSSLFLLCFSWGAGREVSLFVLTSQTLEVRKQRRRVLNKILLSDIREQKPKHIRHYTTKLKTISISENKKIPTISDLKRALFVSVLAVGSLERSWEKMIYYSRVFSLSLHLMLTIICSYHSI